MREERCCPCGVEFVAHRDEMRTCAICRLEARKAARAEAQLRHYREVIRPDPERYERHKEEARQRMARLRAHRRQHGDPTWRAQQVAEAAQGAWELCL